MRDRNPFTRTQRPSPSKNAKPMGALASMESSSASVSRSPSRCTSSLLTMMLKLVVSSPASFEVVIGKGNVPARSVPSLKSCVASRRWRSGLVMVVVIRNSGTRFASSANTPYVSEI